VTPLERFLAALLTPAQQNGHGLTARCPAHDDRRASLSSAEGDDGGVLLRCFAGCSLEATVAAVGLQVPDLFPPRDRNETGRDAEATDTRHGAAVRHLYMRVLRHNLLEVDAEVDQMRHDLETLHARLGGAIARRDDLQHRLVRAVEEAQR
jgi:hypothetical protein